MWKRSKPTTKIKLNSVILHPVMSSRHLCVTRTSPTFLVMFCFSLKQDKEFERNIRKIRHTYPNRLNWASPCRCPMLRWLRRTSWRFTSPASPLSTSGRPTRTSAWLWPACSPSLTAPPPASSAQRPTVSTALLRHVPPAEKPSCPRCERRLWWHTWMNYTSSFST